MLALPECKWHFADTIPALGRSQYVDEDLETRNRQISDHLKQKRPAQQKVAAHRIGYRHSENQAAQLAAEIAENDARSGELTHAAAFHVSARDDNVEALLLCLSEHGRKQGLIVLQIAVHYCDPRCSRRKHAFDTR